MRIPLICMMLVLALTSAACSASVGSLPNNAVPPVATETATRPSRSPSPVPVLPTAMPAGSAYTDLSERVCKNVKPGPDEEGIIYKGECPGFGGYKVVNLSTDHTQALDIIDPAGKKHDVDFRGALGTVADVFLGDQIEWRTKEKGKDTKPHAFIIRVNVQKEPGNYDKQDSNLAVAKITSETICVTDIVPPSQKDQNDKARELSDTAASRPCKKVKSE